MDQPPTCATCRYFDAPDSIAGSVPKNGLCRVQPPSVNAVKPWPVVQRTDWCGAHADRTIPPMPVEPPV